MSTMVIRDGTLFTLDEVKYGLQLTFPAFQNMCIAAGCDYLKNIKGFGIKKSYDLSKIQGANFLQVLSQMRGAPANYMADFKKLRQFLDIKLFSTLKPVRLFHCKNAWLSSLQSFKIYVESILFDT